MSLVPCDDTDGHNPDVPSLTGTARTGSVPTDTVVIVTGGSTGSGRQLARALAGRGYAVVVVYLDDQRGADATVDEILRADGTAIAIRADIMDELDVERLFNETAAVFGGVDVIVHADPRAALVMHQQAAGQLRDGGAIITIGRSDPLPPRWSISRLRVK